MHGYRQVFLSFNGAPGFFLSLHLSENFPGNIFSILPIAIDLDMKLEIDLFLKEVLQVFAGRASDFFYLCSMAPDEYFFL